VIVVRQGPLALEPVDGPTLPKVNPLSFVGRIDSTRAGGVAWREYLPKRSEVDFEEWRLDAAYHTAKYARWDARK
jgi:hypothetical protein